MSEPVFDRRVTLGGETRARGIVAGSRHPLEWVGMIATALPIIPLVVGGTISVGRVVAAVLVAAAAFGCWTPFPGPLRGRSVAGWVTGRVRSWSRRRAEPRFVPAHAADGDATKGAGRYTTPVAVGITRPVDMVLPSGEHLAAVRHSNPGRKHFYTIGFEMVGTSAGIEGEVSFGAAHEDWGKFLRTLARPGSFIRTVQQVTRIVPYDTADHTQWVTGKIPNDVHGELGASYVELLDLAAAMTEQHRTWLVLRAPITTVFAVAAARLGQGEAGEISLLTRDVVAAMHRAGSYGLALRPLDERRLGSVIRALQDPDHPIDKIAGMDYENAWLPIDQRHRHKIIVEGQAAQWHTRTAIVPRHGIEAGRFAPDFLHPLASNVAPSVVRTISTTIDLLPAHTARDRAKQDVTLDSGASTEAAGRVNDGSEDEQLTSSIQRLRDLRPGTGNHGAEWGMTITFAARTDEELAIASQQIEDAAEEAHITELEYLDGWHEAGLVTSLPLGRGLKVHR